MLCEFLGGSLTSKQGYTVFSIPVGVIYRPNQAKVKNLKSKDYLGKARLVAASDRANAFTGFTGSELKNVSCDSWKWWVYRVADFFRPSRQ